MQPDLIGLEMTQGELRRLTGFRPDQVFRPSIMANREQRLKFLRHEMTVVLVLTLIIVGFVYVFIILPTRGSSVMLGIILLIVVAIALLAGLMLWRRVTFPKTLIILLDQVDKYHAVIKAIDIQDQLASVENQDDREKVVSALQLVREDLVQGLKTERILRDNKKLLANNQDLFINNVETLHAMSDATGKGKALSASEYAQLLNQSLQIALDVQAQLRKLRKI